MDGKRLELPYENRFSREKLFEFIVFLSFNRIWTIFIVLNVAALYVYYTYGIFVETPEFLTKNKWIRFVFDFPYLIDVITTFIHRKFTSWSCRRIHKPRRVAFSFINIITLIPYHLILKPSKEKWTYKEYLIYGIPCLRIYRIILYTIEISSLIGYNSWSNVLQKFVIIVMIALHTMSCLWYKVGCLDYVKVYVNHSCPLNWAVSVSNKYISPSTKPEWYFIAFYYVNVVISTAGFGDILSTNDNERLLTVFFITGGWLLTGIFLGNCTSIQVQNFHHRASFFRRFNLIKVELDQQKINMETQKKMMDFYTTFWTHRQGIRFSQLHMALPLPMRLEVDVDTYCLALNRSHIFHQLSDASKQALAKVMETELYMPGEIVQHRGTPKTSMLYISSGTLNVLSATDDETPIVSLTSGTLLGEVNLVLRCPSAVQIEAATYTEVQVLEQQNMLSLVSSYPEIFQQAKFVYEAKLRDAKTNAERRKSYSILGDSRVLQNLKKSIRRRNKERMTLQSSIWFLDEELEENMVYAHDEVSEGYVYIDDNLNLYQMPVGTEDRVDNDVCVQPRCPWVFNPSNDFLFIWDCTVFLSVLIICITFPYYIGFKNGIPPEAISFVWGVSVIYILDIYFQLTTALDIGGVIVSDLKIIISRKVSSPYFAIDVLATIPWEIFVLAVEKNTPQSVINILKLNRVLKAYKILKFFQRLERNIKLNIGTVRMFKSLLCLTLGAFWMGTIFYMLACDHQHCKHESWMAIIIVEDSFDLVLQLEVTRHHYEALLSLYGALQMIAGVGLGDVVPRTYLEISVVIFFLLLGTLLIVYLIADYSAMLILESKNRMQFKELVLMMQKFLENSNMPIPFQRRVYDYLALQWTYREGFYMLNDKSVYFDAPERISNEVEIARRAHILSNIPIFKYGNQEFINKLSIMANSHILPPNEMVIYAGDMCHEFYILEEGYCVEIAGATGDVLRVLSPPMEFCTTEMLFSICVVNSVRTVTHCKLSRLTYHQIFKVLLQYPDLERDINRTMRNIRGANLLSTLTEAEAVLTIHEEQKQVKSSWYTYPASSKKFKNVDYLRPFMDLQTFHFVRFILLNKTMLPYGRFLKWWEGFRSIFAFASSMLFPPLTHLSVASPWLLYVCPVLDLLALVDMYMRLHIGYYNENGILVSHPWWTAKHYIKNDFIFDLLGCIPINYFFLNVVITSTHTTNFQWKDNIIKYVVQMNRVIQARRIPTIIAHLETSLLAHTQVLKFLKYVPISVVLTNTLASLLVGFSVSFYRKKPPNVNPNSWISALKYKEVGYDLTSPFHVHIYALNWMAGCAASVGSNIMTAQSGIEMFFAIASIVSGYLLYTFVTVKISSSKVNDNINLTSYQEKMRHLIKFINTEGQISKELKHQIIEHFEHIWQRTRGVHASKIIGKFYNALKRDAVLHLFEETLMKVPTFAGLGRSFYQRLGMILREDYYIKGAYLLKRNDIVTNIYIVHKGEVVVDSGDGTQMEVLESGSLFGNIFNCIACRSLQTFIANKHVDVLITSNEKFYTLVEDFPIVKSRLEKSYENYTGYLKQFKTDTAAEELQGLLKRTSVSKKTKKRNYLETFMVDTIAYRFIAVILLLCSFLSYTFITYQAAFQDHRLFFLCVTYALEVVYLIKLCMGFYLPYRDESGEVITNRKNIVRRYVRSPTGLWLDLISALPIDILILICIQSEKRWEWASYIRCSQMIRIVYVFRYFNLKYERLNINMILQKMSSTATYFVLFTHSAACLWYIIGKHSGSQITWVYQNNTARSNGKIFQYHNPYYISFYFITALMSTVGPSDIPYTTLPELMFTLIIVFFIKPITALFIGEMSATIASSTYTLVNKDHDTTILSIYMKNDQVSNPLIKKVVNYVKMLWVLGRGMQVPDFLIVAPRYLREEFKVTTYGMHIHEAVIFKGCDSDFLRQLITYFKRFTFFPGNFIAYEGEVNNRMYFIHQGVIEVVTRDGSIEYLHDVLNERDIFGITQGLRNGTPHAYTFKAVTVVIVLALKLTDWDHLAEFFPSSKEQIFQQLDALNF